MELIKEWAALIAVVILINGGIVFGLTSVDVDPVQAGIVATSLSMPVGMVGGMILAMRRLHRL